MDTQAALLGVERTSRVVERLIELVESPHTGDIHDAVVEGLANAADYPAALQTALSTLGLRAARLVQSPSVALETVGPMRPLVVVGVLEGVEGVFIVSAREGGRVQVETMDGGPRWVDVTTVLATRGMGESVAATWLSVDSALPLGGATHGGDHPSPRRRLLRWMRAERQDLLVVVVYGLFLGVFTLTMPVAAQALVAAVSFGTLLQPLVVLSALLLAALVFSGVLRAAQVYVVEILQRRIFVRVVADLSHRLPRVRRSSLDRVDGAELVNRFFDTFTVQKSAMSLLVGGLEISLTVFVGMVVLAFYHPFLLALDVVLVALIAVIVFLLGRRGASTAIAESARKYEMAAWFEEVAKHDVLFKVGGGLEYAERRAEAIASGYLHERKDHFGVVFRQTLAVLGLQALVNTAVLGLGGWLVIGRQLTLGQLVAAELIVTTVVASIAKIGTYLESYYDLVAAVDKLGYLADLPLEREGGSGVEGIGASGTGATLTVENLHGGYAGRDAVLQGVSLAVPSGARVAISGSTGAGKSLFVEMLSALREPSAGRIVVDGHDIRDVQLAAFRRKIAVVRPEVLSGSILENVRLGRVGIDVRDVREALAMVGLLDEVDAMPSGLQTELSSTGVPLSTGQQLRLAVARAIAGHPALLVLDDALDGLDPRVRDPMLEQILDPRHPWTVVLVTNEPSIQARCQVAYQLIDGRCTRITKGGVS